MAERWKVYPRCQDAAEQLRNEEVGERCSSSYVLKKFTDNTLFPFPSLISAEALFHIENLIKPSELSSQPFLFSISSKP